MPNIKPISDLRNYSSVLASVTDGKPVYLTKNGHGSYVVYTIEEADQLEADRASLRAMLELNKGYSSGEKEGWLSADEIRAHLKEKRQTEKKKGE